MLREMGMAFWLPEAERDLAGAGAEDRGGRLHLTGYPPAMSSPLWSHSLSRIDMHCWSARAIGVHSMVAVYLPTLTRTGTTRSMSRESVCLVTSGSSASRSCCHS